MQFQPPLPRKENFFEIFHVAGRLNGLTRKALLRRAFFVSRAIAKGDFTRPHAVKLSVSFLGFVEPVLVLHSLTMLSSRVVLILLRWRFLFFLLPFAALLVALSLYGVDVPFGDDLYFAPLLDRVVTDGSFVPSDLLVQRNEHIVLFPYLATLIVTVLIGWHAKVLLFLKPFLALFNVFAVSVLAHRFLPRSTLVQRTTLTLVATVLFFSFTQWEIWSHAITLNLFLVNTAVLAGIFVLGYPRSFRTVLFGAFFCFVASFSANHGLLSWLALAPLVVYRDPSTNRVPLRYFFVWLVLFLGTVLLYYTHYVRPEWPPSLAYGFHHPDELFLFLVTALGAPLSPFLDVLTMVIGLVVLLVSLFLGFVWWRHRWPFTPLLPFACLWLFSFMATFSLALGRVGFSVSKALTSRYVPLPQLALVALPYALFLYADFSHQERLKRMLGLLAAVVIISQIGLSVASLDRWRSRSASLTEGYACLTHYGDAPASCLAKLGHSAISGEDVRRLGPTLMRLGVIP